MGQAGSQRFRIEGMDCGSCAMTIETALRKLPGVASANVSFATESAQIEGVVAADSIDHTLRQLGYRLASAPSGRAVANEPPATPRSSGLSGFWRFCWSRPTLRIALVLGLACIAATALAMSGVWHDQQRFVYWLTVLIAGWPVATKGCRALWFTRRMTIDLLMGVAALGAIAIGESGEAATVILLYTLGEALEAYSAARARDSLQSIVALQPQEATVLEVHAGETHAAAQAPPVAGSDHDHDHDHGHDHRAAAHVHASTRPVSQVNVGELLLIRPGQRVPLDGTIESGESSIDESTLTGESVPVPKRAGDSVLAGTINHEGALQVRVTQPATDSTVARIARLVEQAQAQRSPTERWIDRFAQWYTPAVVLLAALVVAVPVLAFGAPLMNSVTGEHGWLYRGLALLIIACPCALVISIPVTVVSALTRLANLGVLVRGGAQLDALADVRAIAMDKTGTLTRGKPAVMALRSTDCAHPDDAENDCRDCDDVVAVAATVESSSEHPIAHAILAAADARGVRQRYAQATKVRARAGFGVSGEWQDGSAIAVGSAAMFADRVPNLTNIAAPTGVALRNGNTVMLVARNEQVIGYVGVQDQLRDSSVQAVAELRALPRPPRLIMLTGDGQVAAERIAELVGGLDEIQAGLLPEGKLNAITALRERHGRLAMVGDGINDAPALARADVGVSLGRAGATQAVETADVVLMHDDLLQLPHALRIARRMRQVVQQNIALSLGLKIAFLVLAVPGLATIWMAVVADVGTTLLVTLNGMRMLRES